MIEAVKGTPLCPAGHLPLKGGDRYAAPLRPSLKLRVSECYNLADLPLEGEMPGRAEGGALHPPSATSPIKRSSRTDRYSSRHR
ncbi:hypothetical protein BTE54_18065 [Agrobacterium sp. YIC 4121]|nr:hypothetical protein BTE54_18065 [Agrobacterium sp. YIC 4121]